MPIKSAYWRETENIATSSDHSKQLARFGQSALALANVKVIRVPHAKITHYGLNGDIYKFTADMIFMSKYVWLIQRKKIFAEYRPSHPGSLGSAVHRLVPVPDFQASNVRYFNIVCEHKWSAVFDYTKDILHVYENQIWSRNAILDNVTGDIMGRWIWFANF